MVVVCSLSKETHHQPHSALELEIAATFPPALIRIAPDPDPDPTTSSWCVAARAAVKLVRRAAAGGPPHRSPLSASTGLYGKVRP